MSDFPVIVETITRARRMKEEDQFFMVGDFNVTFYFDAYLDKPVHVPGGNPPIPKREFYMAEIIKFDNEKELGRKHIYVLKEDENTYGKAWQELHKENVLDSFVRYAKENERFGFDGVGFTRMEVEA